MFFIFLNSGVRSSVFLKSVNLLNQGSLWRTAKANFFNEMHISDIEGKICCQDFKNIGSQGYNTQTPPSPLWAEF